MFKIVVLGCRGGPLENNLSAYLVTTTGCNSFIALDAGTLLSGIEVAFQLKSFKSFAIPPSDTLLPEAAILQNHIKAYFISHAHIDHIAGLVVNSPNDSPKKIYGIAPTIANLRNHVFNWAVWPNAANEGVEPCLNLYHYHELEEGETIQLADPAIAVTSYRLSHPNNYASTAFLLEAQGSYLLYFGDTAPDSLEEKKRLQKIWKVIAPLIREKKLCALFLECSYPNERQDGALFGHLKPVYFMQEMVALANTVDPQNPKEALKGLKIVVTHVKEAFDKEAIAHLSVAEELQQLNDLGLDLVYPSQGELLEL